MMTLDAQYAMCDCAVADLDAILVEQTAKGQTAVPLVVRMLRDIHAMLAMGMSRESVQCALNRAAYFLEKGTLPRI